MANNRSGIGIWGPSGSGKTAYLAALDLAIFDGHMDDWDMVKDEETTKFFVEHGARLRQEGIFPPPTGMNAPPQLYNVRFKREGGPMGYYGRQHRVRLIDAAGGLILGNEPQSAEFFDKLRASRGLLLMIDSEYGAKRANTDYFALLEVLFAKLERNKQWKHRNGKLAGHFAICVTKVDHKEDIWKGRKKPERLFERAASRQALNLIRARTNSAKFFSVSITGVHRGTNRSNSTDDPTGTSIMIDNRKQWQPYGLAEPLMWLFDRLEEDNDRVTVNPLRYQLRRAMREPNYPVKNTGKR